MCIWESFYNFHLLLRFGIILQRFKRFSKWTRHPYHKITTRIEIIEMVKSRKAKRKRKTVSYQNKTVFSERFTRRQCFRENSNKTPICDINMIHPWFVMGLEGNDGYRDKKGNRIEKILSHRFPKRYRDRNKQERAWICMMADANWCWKRWTRECRTRTAGGIYLTNVLKLHMLLT